MGPLVPVCGHWLARASVLKFLLHLTVVSLALSSQFFPYSSEAPKRVVFQHTIVSSGKLQCLTFDIRQLHVYFKLDDFERPRLLGFGEIGAQSFYLLFKIIVSVV